MIYLLIIWGDTWPEIEGPFDSFEERDAYAGKFRAKEGDEHGLFKMFIENSKEFSVYPYGGGEMEELVEEWKPEN